jgi:hypothetical protein
VLQVAFSVGLFKGYMTSSNPVQFSESVQCSSGHSVEELRVLTSRQQKLELCYREMSNENIAKE